MTAYYNEIDPYAADWLRNLIAAGHIAPGDVDERDIRDVRPDDLRGYAQCHFFAGIGVWSYALRRGGWPDERPIWTGSCPCQPFSSAGGRGGFDDERHLWPAFHWLIEQCRPPLVAGEQVASKDGLAWLDLVQADLEGSGYASGAVDLCAAGVGAPHIRQRLKWAAVRLADAVRCRAGHDAGGCLGAQAAFERGDRSLPGQRLRPWFEGASGGLADGEDGRCDSRPGSRHHGPAGERGYVAADDRFPFRVADVPSAGSQRGALRRAAPLARQESAAPERDGAPCRLADTGCERLRGGQSGGVAREAEAGAAAAGERQWLRADAEHGGARVAAGPTNGLWRDADWLFCRDGRWRPVEPGTFPLAHGAPARVGRLRAYGNAIVAPAAEAFVEALIYATGGDLA